MSATKSYPAPLDGSGASPEAGVSLERRTFVTGTASALVGTTLFGASHAGHVSGADETAKSTRVRPLTFQFAAAMQPRAEQLFPSERWLKALAAAGMSHLFLQIDPFFHPERSPGEAQDFGLSLLGLFDMVDGPVSGSYQAWLRGVSDAAGRHGLKLGMEMWEPVVPEFARQTMPAEWFGPPITKAGYKPLCVSQPGARAWLLKAFQILLSAAPAMDAIALGTGDNGAELCDERCPRCGSVPIQQRYSDLCRDIAKACREVRSDFQLIPYDWEWPDDYFEPTLAKLPPHSFIVTRLERFAAVTPDPEQPNWSGHVYDQSLGCDQLGPGFRRAQNAARNHNANVLAMPTLSGMFEGWQLPYVPAAGQVAKKFALMRAEKCAGWLDYDCGGIHEGLVLDLVGIVQHNPQSSAEEWLRLLAVARYGEQAVATALATWKAFDAAVQGFPAVLDFESIHDYPGRFGVAASLIPMHPFLPERAILGKDAGTDHSWFDPHNFLTREAIVAVRTCMQRALEYAQGGWSHAQKLVSQTMPSNRASAQFDASMAELTCLSWQSISNFFAWAAFLQGDGSVPIEREIENEIAGTQRYRQLLGRPDLQVGNMTWAWQEQVAWSLRRRPGTEEPRDRAADLAAEYDFVGLKLQGLQQQLDKYRGTSQ